MFVVDITTDTSRSQVITHVELCLGNMSCDFTFHYKSQLNEKNQTDNFGVGFTLIPPYLIGVCAKSCKTLNFL